MVGALTLALLLLDGARPPSEQWGAQAAASTIEAYRAHVSPRLGSRCRLVPTCSHYGLAVVRSHGLLPGLWLTTRRLLRCGPWTPVGTVDPPPAPAAGADPGVPRAPAAP